MWYVRVSQASSHWYSVGYGYFAGRQLKLQDLFLSVPENKVHFTFCFICFPLKEPDARFSKKFVILKHKQVTRLMAPHVGVIKQNQMVCLKANVLWRSVLCGELILHRCRREPVYQSSTADRPTDSASLWEVSVRWVSEQTDWKPVLTFVNHQWQ